MRIMFLNQSPRNPRGDAAHDRVQSLLRSYASPGTELDLCYPDDFPGARVMRVMGGQNILTGLHHAMAASALVRKTVWAQENGYDGTGRAGKDGRGRGRQRRTSSGHLLPVEQDRPSARGDPAMSVKLPVDA